MTKPLPENPTQQDIQTFLDARVDEERAAMEARLKNRISQPIPLLNIEAGTPQQVRLQVAPIVCWKCKETIKAPRGYIFDYNDEDRAFVSLRQASDTRQITALITELRKREPTIAPVRFNYSKQVGGQYFSARCPHCGAICGDFHMTSSTFFDEQCICKFPNCECCYSADTQCQECQYHNISLRLNDDELDEIAEQVGAVSPAMLGRNND